MQTANEWLLENGFIKAITRGRMSGENQTRLYEAHLSGVRFSNWEPKETTDHKGEFTTRNAVKPAGGQKIVSDINIRFPKRDFQATAHVDGKAVDVGMAEVCANCQTISGGKVVASLVGHLCESPSVLTCPGALGTVTRVVIEPRTRKLPIQPWS